MRRRSYRTIIRSLFLSTRLVYFTFNIQCSILRVQSKYLLPRVLSAISRLFLVLLFHCYCCRRRPKYTRIHRRLIRVQLRIRFWNGSSFCTTTGSVSHRPKSPS
ncbi:hypothetical protein DFH05DRAFT_1477496 [Lentinula detonsa]|uniref:Uncharacterized protein n=1 Tax=Lentinula detonsa TaxID=2804962 RepID=A0A9W8P9G7_9AGAR|nr:hypothetical protein DFH05DRAFT_1477496 [Lentinula detonsa]